MYIIEKRVIVIDTILHYLQHTSIFKKIVYKILILKYILVRGTLGKSLAHKLKCRKYRTLQKGEQNFFLIRTELRLGVISSVRLWLTDDRTDDRKITW